MIHCDLDRSQGKFSHGLLSRKRSFALQCLACRVRLPLEVARHCWPTHHENIHFYGTHSVNVDGELAKLDSDGYRPLRAATAAEAP